MSMVAQDKRRYSGEIRVLSQGKEYKVQKAFLDSFFDQLEADKLVTRNVALGENSNETYTSMIRNMSAWFWVVFVAVVIGAVAAFAMSRKNKQQTQTKDERADDADRNLFGDYAYEGGGEK